MTLGFLIQRLALMGFTLLVISIAIFGMTQLLPGDVATSILGNQATPEDLATLREQLGLNRPVIERYLDWLGGIAHGDWGTSLALGTPVGPLLMERLGKSVILAAGAIAIGVPLAIALGIGAGLT
ncbi:MAG TPA: ABC transporter permease, partial [Chloroflexota bacterium]|nr:ABC transporter permease [Chloroflexota bacterium]